MTPPRHTPEHNLIPWTVIRPDWPLLRLKHATRLVNSKTTSTERTYVGLEHVEPWTGRLLDVESTVLAEGQASLFEPGDVLLGKLRPYLAKVFHATTGSGRCTSELLVLRPHRLLPEYLKHLLLSEPFVRLVDSSTFGAKMPRADWDFIGRISVPCPSIPDQRAIAGFLDRRTAVIDALIEKKDSLRQILLEKRRALLAHVVTRGLKAGVSWKIAGLDWVHEIPAHWRVLPIKRLAMPEAKAFSDGDWIEAPFITDSGVRLLQTGNIGVGIYKEQGFRYVSNETFESLRCTEVRPRDVLICRLDGPVGRACLAPELGVRMITSVDNAILRTGREHDPRFIVHVLSIPEYLDWVQGLCRVGGGFRFRISRSMLGDFRVPVPPLEEQRAIADHVEQVTEPIRNLETRLEASMRSLVAYRQALITAAVTGQLDVKSEAA